MTIKQDSLNDVVLWKPGDPLSAARMNKMQSDLLGRRSVGGKQVTGRAKAKDEIGSVVRIMQIQSVAPDYLVCWEWDVTANPPAYAGPDILVAKPFLAVQSIWDGGAANRAGVTFAFAANPPDGQDLVASKTGETDENWAMTPYWLVGDEIDVIDVPDGTGVFDLPANNPARKEIFLLDINTDGRAWAVVPPGTAPSTRGEVTPTSRPTPGAAATSTLGGRG